MSHGVNRSVFTDLNLNTLKTLLIVISLIFSLIGTDPTISVVEVPVFKLNFYLMGMQEVDQEVTVRIGENIEYLNQEFEGRIVFELDQMVMDPNHAYIPDLHKAYIDRESKSVNELVDPIEIEGAINIYLFDTYSTDNGNSAMLGFTPVLSAQHSKYKTTSPSFDRLYISYPGLIDQSTIVHEMGHFLGLSHPWEMNDVSLDMMGLKNSEAEHNHMSYHPLVNHFTEQQLDRMQHFALNFRNYLISRIEYKAFVSAS